MPKNKTPREYLQEPYHWVLIPDKTTKTMTAYIEEFPGCITQFDESTELEDSIKKLLDCAEAWIAASLKQGLMIPKPYTNTFKKYNATKGRKGK